MWQPIDTVPEHDPVLLFIPRINRGRGSCEVAIMIRIGSGADDITWWTNGGPNAGDEIDWSSWSDNYEVYPTHWMPLPADPTS